VGNPLRIAGHANIGETAPASGARKLTEATTLWRDRAAYSEKIPKLNLGLLKQPPVHGSPVWTTTSLTAFRCAQAIWSRSDT